MDRALYVAMTGAQQTQRALTATNNNIANASTTGFRAELAAMQAVPVQGQGWNSRVNTVAFTSGWDPSAGALMTTGRELDVAMRDNGWLAVQAADGSEAYTRAGDLQVTSLGQLVTGAGHVVMGDGGPIAVPPHARIAVGEDGTVSIVPLGSGPETVTPVGRLKVVAAEPSQLTRGADGLMRAEAGVELPPVAGTSVMTGTLEGANVNMAESLVSLIELSRRYEMQVKMMRTVEGNGEAGQSLLRMR